VHRGVVVLSDEFGDVFREWVLHSGARARRGGGVGPRRRSWGSEGRDYVGAEVGEEVESGVDGER